MKMKAHQFILALSVSFFSHSILSQSKVVVIPLFGDDTSAQWRGGWAVDTMYEQSDIVEFDGSSYFALIGHTATLANIPPSDAEWDLVAAAGANGATGDQGNQGIQGERGEKGEQGLPGVQGPQGDKGGSRSSRSARPTRRQRGSRSSRSARPPRKQRGSRRSRSARPTRRQRGSRRSRSARSARSPRSKGGSGRIRYRAI